MLIAVAILLLTNCALCLRVLRRLDDTKRSQEQDSLMLAALMRAQAMLAHERGMIFRQMPVKHLQEVVDKHARD